MSNIQPDQLARSYDTALAALHALQNALENDGTLSANQPITISYGGRPFPTNVAAALGMALQELQWVNPTMNETPLIEDRVTGTGITLEMARAVINGINKKD